ncbi:MAG: tRNA lysidine(34) synthetase TilS [Fusobacterium sp.]|nr:tRNA lysidine(34) synthetase TilS [Fusobacterium sp.]
MLKSKVEAFLKQHSIAGSVLVAFSGGFDSMCLLNVLLELNFQPVAIHLNHNWRGEESRQEEENCRNFCLTHGVEFYSETLSSDVPHTETAAREARYDFFERCAERFNSKVVLTAHNADDNAETLLYRIAKGTGLEGLKGIAPVRGIFYRPLLTTYRTEIEEYCKSHNLTPNSDSSNENTKYKRNLIRKNILPELEKINPEAKSALNTLSENARNDAEIINEYLASLKDKFKTQNFIKFSTAVQNRIIYELLCQNNFEYDKKRIEEIVKFINENAMAKNGKTLSITGGTLLFASEKEIRLINERTSYNIQIEECTQKPENFPPDSDGIAYVDLSGITDYTIRHREDGDVIHPLGATGSQKLKKYLNYKAIPKDIRDELLFLCEGKEVLWAPLCGISEKIKIKDEPTHILRLERI